MFCTPGGAKYPFFRLQLMNLSFKDISFSYFRNNLFLFIFSTCFASTIFGAIQKVRHSGRWKGVFTKKVPKVAQGEGVQVCSEGASTLASEVLTINCQTCFKEFFSFNYLMSNFSFWKRYIFRRQKITAVKTVRPYFQMLNPTRKMMTFSRHNKVLRCRILCTNILKCEFQAKGIEPTRFDKVLPEVL